MKTLFPLLIPFCLLLAGSSSSSQLPQGTDIWLFDLSYKMNQPSITDGVNISNRKGYDNQPSFSEGGNYLVYTAEQSDGQTDIMRYEIAKKQVKKLTSTAESEYSPIYLPGNKYIVSVVVEKDSSQRIWSYHKETMKSEPMIPRFFGVGYHCWIDEHTCFAFQLGEPSMLVMADSKDGKTKNCISNIGRCVQSYRSPQRKLVLYTQMNADSLWQIKALTTEGEPYTNFSPVSLPKDCQDFTVDNFNNLFAAQGSKLLCYNLNLQEGWKKLGDFSNMGIQNITRLALNSTGNKLALVSNKIEE